MSHKKGYKTVLCKDNNEVQVESASFTDPNEVLSWRNRLEILNDYSNKLQNESKSAESEAIRFTISIGILMVLLTILGGIATSLISISAYSAILISSIVVFVSNLKTSKKMKWIKKMEELVKLHITSTESKLVEVSMKNLVLEDEPKIDLQPQMVNDRAITAQVQSLKCFPLDNNKSMKKMYKLQKNSFVGSKYTKDEQSAINAVLGYETAIGGRQKVMKRQ